MSKLLMMVQTTPPRKFLPGNGRLPRHDGLDRLRFALNPVALANHGREA
jgi:hypothetical protein